MRLTCLRAFLVLLLSLLLAACGGGDSSGGTPKVADATNPAATPAPAGEQVVNVYNWSDYIAEDTIANFEKETGIKVRYDVFDSNEVLEAKLLAGNTGYDVVVPSSKWACMPAGRNFIGAPQSRGWM